MKDLFIGSAMCSYEVDLPAILTGHINRNVPADDYLDYPEIHVAILKQDSCKFAFISLDLLEMDFDISNRIREAVAFEICTKKDHVILSCSHCHTMPAAIKLGLVPIDKEFVELLSDKIVETARRANCKYQRCLIKVSSGLCKGVGINRRKNIGGQIVMAPNPDGVVKNDVLVYWFVLENGNPVCSFVNFSMHATTLDVSIYKVSADYPAYIRQRLMERFNGLNVLFFNGACGDVRPALVGPDGNFRGGDESDIKAIGRKIGNTVIASWNSSSLITDVNLICNTDSMVLKYDYDAREKAKSRKLAADSGEAKQINQELLGVALDAWRDDFMEREKHSKPIGVAFELQAVSFSDNVKFLALPGEIFTDTALEIEKGFSGSIMIAAYSNGSVGYVPTSDALDAGGYEAEDAYKLYDQNAPFERDTADRIVETALELIGR